MSEASLRNRQPATDDPVVCEAYGATLGTRHSVASLTETQRVAATAAHEQECQQRRDHQRRHRTLTGRCPECRSRP